MRRCSCSVLALIVCCASTNPPHTFAATAIFNPVADTTLIEIAPANNLGGFAGMHAGTTQSMKKNRALFRFDLSALPASTVVFSATVQLAVTREPGPGEPSNNSAFGLHRLLTTWGEGNKNPSFGIGQGLPATLGEATWTHAFYSTNSWSGPGGASDVDFSSIQSSFQEIYGTDQSPYVFANTPEMIADVTTWLQSPQNNFGWMLLGADESIQSTARRFGSREDASNPPILELQYLVPPDLHIVKTNPASTQLHFTAWAEHSYEVLYRNSLSTGTWLTLTNISPAPTNYAAGVTDPAALPQRFYRLRAY